MKKSIAITIIAILAVAAIALGVLYYTNNDSKTKEIAARDADIADKAGQIEVLNTDVAGKRGEIENLTEDVSSRDGQIDTLNKLVDMKNGEIETLNADVAYKTGQIDTLTIDVKEKAGQIETLKADVEDKADQIEVLSTSIKEKDKEIENLNAIVKEQKETIERISSAPKVGIALPDERQRWYQDGHNMELLLRESGYEVELRYASKDLSRQYFQIEDMIEDGCKVIIIAAVEMSSLGQVLDKAAEKGVKIIAYDRLLMDNENVDYYVTFNNYRVGVIQGLYVRDALNLDKVDGPFYIEFTAGDSTDSNGEFFFNGALDILKPYIDSGKVIVKSGQTQFNDVATRGWKSENAQMRAEEILTDYYADGTGIDAWVCVNDSTAVGVINALEEKYSGNWPVITGQDCEKTNVKYLIAGKQAMSVFRDTRILVDQTVKMVDQILKGEMVDVNDMKTYDNNKKNVPAFLCTPVYCDVNNYKELLIDSGFYTESDFE